VVEFTWIFIQVPTEIFYTVVTRREFFSVYCQPLTWTRCCGWRSATATPWRRQLGRTGRQRPMFQAATKSSCPWADWVRKAPRARAASRPAARTCSPPSSAPSPAPSWRRPTRSAYCSVVFCEKTDVFAQFKLKMQACQDFWFLRFLCRNESCF